MKKYTLFLFLSLLPLTFYGCERAKINSSYFPDIHGSSSRPTGWVTYKTATLESKEILEADCDVDFRE